MQPCVKECERYMAYSPGFSFDFSDRNVGGGVGKRGRAMSGMGVGGRGRTELRK